MHGTLTIPGCGSELSFPLLFAASGAVRCRLLFPATALRRCSPQLFSEAVRRFCPLLPHMLHEVPLIFGGDQAMTLAPADYSFTAANNDPPKCEPPLRDLGGPAIENKQWARSHLRVWRRLNRKPRVSCWSDKRGILRFKRRQLCESNDEPQHGTTFPLHHPFFGSPLRILF